MLSVHWSTTGLPIQPDVEFDAARARCPKPNRRERGLAGDESYVAGVSRSASCSNFDVMSSREEWMLSLV
jgi:hypothetical protein